MPRTRSRAGLARIRAVVVPRGRGPRAARHARLERTQPGAPPVRRRRRRWLRRLALTAFTCTVAVSTAMLLAYSRVRIPAPHPDAVMQSTVFLDMYGEYLGRRGPVDRQAVPLSRIPRHAQDAVIAAENRSFRTDSGIAPTAIARALLAAVTGGAKQGGSTITQQYVKNALLSPERSLSRKAREALLAVKLDRTWSKDKILEGYLNTVYFGRGAAGIQSAARNYFGVNVDKLTLSQSAALAAIINLPSYYEKVGADPKVSTTLRKRWDWVLDGMVKGGTISANQRAHAAFPGFRFYPPGNTEGQRQYLIDAAMAEAAKKLDITQDELTRGGYTVHTTFDLAEQDSVAEGVKSMPADTVWRTGTAPPDIRLHTAAVAMVPGDGAVRLLYGGADYAHQPFNDALNGAVEAGTAALPLKSFGLHVPLGQVNGTIAPSPVQMAAAYAAIGTGGQYAAPYVVSTITRGRETVYTAQPKPHQAAPKNRVGFTSPQSPGYPHTIGRTGAAADRTTWTAMYNPELTFVVALFAEHPATDGKPATPARLNSLSSPSGYVQRVSVRILKDDWVKQARPPSGPSHLDDRTTKALPKRP